MVDSKDKNNNMKNSSSKSLTKTNLHLINTDISYKGFVNSQGISLNAHTELNENEIIENGIENQYMTNRGKGKRYRKESKEQKSITKFIQQLFSSDLDISELNIDGYPISGYRKIIARQLSLASQLLIQLFLLTEQNSIEYMKCKEFYDQLLINRQTSMRR